MTDFPISGPATPSQVCKFLQTTRFKLSQMRKDGLLTALPFSNSRFVRFDAAQVRRLCTAKGCE